MHFAKKEFVDKFKKKIEYENVHPRTIKYLEKSEKRMLENSAKRVEDIKIRMKKDVDISKQQAKNKLYQIQSHHEFRQLQKFCKDEFSFFELLWKYDENGVQTNQVDKIIEGDFYCCRDCGYHATIKNKKTPVLYCYFHKPCS